MDLNSIHFDLTSKIHPSPWQSQFLKQPQLPPHTPPLHHRPLQRPQLQDQHAQWLHPQYKLLPLPFEQSSLLDAGQWIEPYPGYCKWYHRREHLGCHWQLPNSDRWDPGRRLDYLLRTRSGRALYHLDFLVHLCPAESIGLSGDHTSVRPSGSTRCNHPPAAPCSDSWWRCFQKYSGSPPTPCSAARPPLPRWRLPSGWRCPGGR